MTDNDKKISVNQGMEITQKLISSMVKQGNFINMPVSINITNEAAGRAVPGGTNVINFSNPEELKDLMGMFMLLPEPRLENLKALVIKSFAKGRTNLETADILGVSHRTITTYKKRPLDITLLPRLKEGD